MNKDDTPINNPISARTVGHYSRSAQRFWEGTRDHDVSQNIEALLGEIEGEGPHAVLDFGCGPGRDLADFVRRGHRPTGLDGSGPFVEMARAHPALGGVEVLHQDFLALDLPQGHFDGVFANATLFHVPSEALPRVLRELWASLKPGGVLFSSNPRGRGDEGWNGERYGVWHNLQGWTAHTTGAGFEPIRHYYRPPGLPRERQPWLASLWRRPKA